MADHIAGPLYYERMGRTGPTLAFVHPNPMDQSSWLFQMAHLSTWYRCVGIDLPGYGRSPKAVGGLTMTDMAQACWEAIDEAAPGSSAILVGCSVGGSVVRHMYHRRPGATAAVVLSGVGFTPSTSFKEFARRRIEQYTRYGVAFRERFAFEDFSAAFRATPLARFFADLTCERDDLVDVPSIIHQFEALGQPDPKGLNDIGCPVIILTGTEDPAHERAFVLQQQIPGSELKALPGAGHACMMEQPWLYDRLLIEFLERRGLFPGTSPTRS